MTAPSCLKQVKLVKKQRGVALIQVLLISTIISILAISFTYTAREQVATANAFEQRIKAQQHLRGAQSKIIYTLLTQSNLEQVTTMFPTSEAWNFHGKPFVLERDDTKTIIVKMQDNEGLLPQQFPGWPLWQRVLENLGYSTIEAKNLRGEIADWQDRDSDSWLIGEAEPVSGTKYRNLPIQLPQEISLFFHEYPDRLALVNKISMYYPIGGFNILNAPDTLLKLILPEDDALKIINSRQQPVDKSEVIDMLGDLYDEEYIKFFTANNINLTIQVELGDARIQETLNLRRSPYTSDPLLIYSRY